MNHLKYFESTIYDQKFDDEDINMVEDLLTELDDLGLYTRVWINRHNKSLKKLSQIEIEVNIEYASKEIYDTVYSRLNKIENYLTSNKWKIVDNIGDEEYVFMKFIR